MKKLKITNPFWQVLGIGALAGMRSSAAPVITSHILSHHRSKLLGKSSLRFMQSAKVATALKTMAISEMIMDKMPTAPNRIAVTGLFARGLSGAVAGASIYKATGGNAWLGAALGSAAAIVSTFGSFYLRKDAVEKTHWLDPVVGAIEDALVIGAGVALVKIDE